MPAISRLVPEQALDLVRRARRASARKPGIDVERVRAQPGDARHIARILDHVDRQRLLGPGLGQVEARRRFAVGRKPHAQRHRPFARPQPARLQRVGPAEPTGLGQMHHQMRIAGADGDELAVAGHSGHGGGSQDLEREVCGLQHREGQHLDVRDPRRWPLRRHQLRPQEIDQSLYLRHLWHALTVTQNAARRSPAIAPTFPLSRPTAAPVTEACVKGHKGDTPQRNA